MRVNHYRKRRGIDKKSARNLIYVFGACTFFLAQLISTPLIGPRHSAQTWQSPVLIPSASAAGRGAQSDAGKGNEGTGKGGNSDMFGLHRDAAGISSPPGRDRHDPSGLSPADELRNINAGTDWPNDKVLDLEIDDKFSIDKPLEINELKETLDDYLGNGGGNGLGLHKSDQKRSAKGNEAPDGRGRVTIPRPAREVVAARSYVREEVLVRNLSRLGRDRAEALGFTVRGALRAQFDDAVTILTIPASMDAVAALALLENNLPAEHFHLNRIYRLSHPAANDNELRAEGTKPIGLGSAYECAEDQCYGRTAIQWKSTFAECAAKLKIGIIDTDIDLAHKSFAGRDIVRSIFIPDGRRLAPSGHGTGILALLGGRPDSSTPGLIHKATFLVASIFFIGDDGEAVTDTISLLHALNWMGGSGVRLVNMSFSGPQDDLLEARIKKLRSQGVVFAAAAGNEGLAAGPSYPAAYQQVIAVTAVDRKLQVYPSANRGVYVDVAAPGVRVWTALPNSREGYRSGTSFAVPFVTAVLAIQRSETLRLLKDDLLDQIKTVPLEARWRSPTYGRGLLQAPGECPNAAEFASKWKPVSSDSPR
jgi:hypothetical protein